MKTKKAIAVVVADAHLDHLMLKTRPEIQGDSFFGFQQAVSTAIERKVPLLLAGDNIECLPVDSPTSETITFLHTQVRQMIDNGLDFYWVQGQHDDSPSWIEAVTGVDGHRDCEVIELGGRSVGFMSYRRSPQLPGAMETMNENPCEILICHQVWKELMGTSSAQASIKDFTHPRLVISGDFHQFKSVKLKRENGTRITAVSPGATHARRISEPGVNYVLVVYDDLTFDRVRLASRLRIELAIDSEDDFEEFYSQSETLLADASRIASEKKLPAKLHKPLLLVADTSDILGVEKRIRASVGDDAHVFYSRMFEGSQQSGSDLETSLDAQFDVPILRYAEMEAGQNSEVMSLIRSGFTAEKPKQGVTAWREDYLKGKRHHDSSMGQGS